MKLPELTIKQQRFVEEYIVALDSTSAYESVYGCSRSVAKVNGHRMLQKAHVAAAIARAKKDRSERTEIDADWVLHRLYRDVSARTSELFDEHGRLKDASLWPDAWQQGLVVGIESFEEYEGTGKDRKAVCMVRKIKLADRTKYIEMIGRHVDVGAFKPLEISGPNGGPIPVQAAHVHLTKEEALEIARSLSREV